VPPKTATFALRVIFLITIYFLRLIPSKVFPFTEL